MGLRTIASGAVDLWWAHPTQIRDPELLHRYTAILDNRERERMARFMFERHRHTYLIAHALVRTVLSRYADVEPADWAFVFNEHGRPDIDPAHQLGTLQFNLTHTEDLAVVAVARSDVGVDAEDVTRRSSTIKVAEHFFAEDEVAQLQSLPAADMTSRFFDFWTLKEAYMKARGMGLALPLNAFFYDLRDLPEISIGFCPPIVDDPASWRMALHAPSARHRIAVALRLDPIKKMQIQGYCVTPLVRCEQVYTACVSP